MQNWIALSNLNRLLYKLCRSLSACQRTNYRQTRGSNLWLILWGFNVPGYRRLLVKGF